MKRILVTGGSGFIGSHICRTLAADGCQVITTFTHHTDRVPKDPGIAGVRVNFRDTHCFDDLFDAVRPAAVVHTAAMGGLGECQQQPELAKLINTDATDMLAARCRTAGARLVHLSTDQVFDGKKGHYTENDVPNPIHVYGQTKLDAEQAIIASGVAATILRVNLAYGWSPAGDRTPVEQIVHAAEQHQRLRFFVDEYRSPILADDIASAVGELIWAEDVPLLHLAGPERVNRAEFGRRILESFGFEDASYATITQADADMTPPRPPDTSMDTTLACSLLIKPPCSIVDGLFRLLTV